MSEPFRVALSGDFRKSDGSPVYPDFDLEPLRQAPGVEFAYLEPRNPVQAEQLEHFDALILLAHRFTKDSIHSNGGSPSLRASAWATTRSMSKRAQMPA